MNAGTRSSLLERMAMATIKIRYLLVLVLAVIGTLQGFTTNALPQLKIALLVGLVSLVVNTFAWIAVSGRMGSVGEEALEWTVFGQAILDVVLFTIVIHLSGGAVSPYAVFYMFPIIMVGMANYRKPWTIFLVALFINLMYDAALFLQCRRAFPFPNTVIGMDQVYANGWQIAIIGVTVPLGIWVVVIFGMMIGGVVRKTRMGGESELSGEIESLKMELSKKLEETNAELYHRNRELEKMMMEKKHAEDLLLKQGVAQQVLLDSIPAWIFYKDRENHFLRINETFARMMGMTKDQMEGRSLFDLFPREQAEAYWKDDQEVLASGVPKRDIIEPMRTARGERWLQLDKIPYRDGQGKVVGVIGFAIDITERKRSESDKMARAEENEKLNRFLIGRELDMVELKKEVNRLLSELGRAEKYKV
ncbi:MAG TPA: PAS domain-containing protein [Candidatus Omnitrophota bacterium]|nr:PAS domain-containing protein [Candidatus Omnitrophota bacterium]